MSVRRVPFLGPMQGVPRALCRAELCTHEAWGAAAGSRAACRRSSHGPVPACAGANHATSGSTTSTTIGAPCVCAGIGESWPGWRRQGHRSMSTGRCCSTCWREVRCVRALAAECVLHLHLSIKTCMHTHTHNTQHTHTHTAQDTGKDAQLHPHTCTSAKLHVRAHNAPQASLSPWARRAWGGGVA